MKQILRKDKRTHEEGMYLYKRLKKFEFFEIFRNKHSETLHVSEALISLCRILKFESVPPETIIFRSGDFSQNRIYMNFLGEVNLYRVGNPQPKPDRPAFKRA
jgi:hypothetical protein